jgi:hypothetical protein
MLPVPDGLVAVVKRDCPTCNLVAPVLAQLAAHDEKLTVVSQDDPAFPDGMTVVDDRDLDLSFALDLDTVPTLLQVEGGREVARIVGWSRDAWRDFTGHDELGDGLPVVPPTPERVARMLTGTTRAPDDVVTVVPPDLVECTVEKVAANAVMAGCRPEHLPIVLAAVEGACTDEFNMHGLLATTWFAGPVVVVNGPIARAVGMNSGINAMGQGNRANASIGRALQLVVRNIGGGRPGEIDRATLGQPGKYTFCFAEDEAGSPWEPLHVERGFDRDASTVTLFAGEGPRGIIDQLSREPESLARSFAWCLRPTTHPKLAIAFDAMLVVSPEHARVFRAAGWTKARLHEELGALLQLDGKEIVRGAGGIAEGVPEVFADATLPKFRDGGLLIVHAGSHAGLFSAIIGGWASGAGGSQPVTREVGT